jgi:hypothetical protein
MSTSKKNLPALLLLLLLQWQAYQLRKLDKRVE